jgi:hypothetical protein
MAVRAKLLTVNCPAATGAQAYTGVGFAPQALIFFCTTRTGDGSGANAQLGVGVATAATERYAWGFNSVDNLAATQVQRAISDAHCVRLVTNDGATTGLEADLDSLDADGFTLDWTVVTNGADVHVLCLGGLTDAKAHGFALATAIGAQAVTGVGFAPDALIALAGTSTTAVASGADAAVNLSAATAAATASLAIGVDDGTGSANAAYIAEAGEFLKLASHVGVVDGTADLTSLDADGFTLNVTVAYDAAYLACALALVGASVKIGTVTVPAGTGTQAITGVGFPPVGLLFFGGHAALLSTARDAHNVFVGAASGPTARAVASSAHVETSDPIVADHDSDTTTVVKALTAGTPTVDWAADLDSLDADGFTLDWTTVGAGAGADQFVYVAFGGGAASAPGTKPPAAPGGKPGPGKGGGGRGNRPVLGAGVPRKLRIGG